MGAEVKQKQNNNKVVYNYSTWSLDNFKSSSFAPPAVYSFTNGNSDICSLLRFHYKVSIQQNGSLLCKMLMKIAKTFLVTCNRTFVELYDITYEPSYVLVSTLRLKCNQLHYIYDLGHIFYTFSNSPSTLTVFTLDSSNQFSEVNF